MITVQKTAKDCLVLQAVFMIFPIDSHRAKAATEVCRFTTMVLGKQSLQSTIGHSERLPTLALETAQVDREIGLSREMPPPIPPSDFKSMFGPRTSRLINIKFSR